MMLTLLLLLLELPSPLPVCALALLHASELVNILHLHCRHYIFHVITLLAPYLFLL